MPCQIASKPICRLAGSLPTLPANPTTEQIQTALKTLKPTCAGIVSEYNCGNHDNVPQYNGSIVQVNAGDEIAMNTMIISIVDIDGSGNGSGLIKVPMRCDESLNNIKLGVTLSDIKVAEGGCVVAGKAELSGVSASILTDKQRVTLEKAYTAYNQVLDVAYENAGAIAETINDFRDGVDKIKAWAKGYKGGNVDAAKAKAYQAFSQQAGKAMLESKAVPDNLKAKLKAASLAAAPAWEFFKTGKPCTASANSGGGNAFFKLPLADCGQYATLIETEMQAMEAASLEIDCNCMGTPSDCNEITQIMNRIKLANASESKLVTFYKNILLTDYRNEGISGLTGIDIGGKCYHLHIENNFSTGTINLDMADFQIDKTSQTIHIKDKNGIVAVSIHRLPKTRGTFDELVAYLGFGEAGNLNSDGLKYKSGREYGWLSATQESQSPCDLGYDKAGGCSYGKHQMAVKTGKLNEFISWMSINYKNELENNYQEFTKEVINSAKKMDSKNSCSSCDLTKAFNKVCSDTKFIDLAHKFIAEKNYKPVYDKIMNLFGNSKLFKDLSLEDEEALKEMCYSLGVQHGGAFKIFEMSLLKDFTGCSESEILDKKNSECSSNKFPSINLSNSEKVEMIKTADSISMSDFIKRVYAARKIYVKNTGIKGWENIVKNRYKTEENQIFSIIYKK